MNNLLLSKKLYPQVHIKTFTFFQYMISFKCFKKPDHHLYSVTLIYHRLSRNSNLPRNCGLYVTHTPLIYLIDELLFNKCKIYNFSNVIVFEKNFNIFPTSTEYKL